MKENGQAGEKMKKAHPKGIKYDKRSIVVGRPFPELGDNSIRTSKYKTWNFVFLNLYEQFKKPANIYFLVNRCSSDPHLSTSHTCYFNIFRKPNHPASAPIRYIRVHAQRFH